MKRPSKLLTPMLAGLLALAGARPGAAEEVWVRPTHFLPAALNLLWPTTGSGFVIFGFAVPEDMDSFVAARVALLPETTFAGSYDVFAEVKRDGEVVSAADLGFSVDNPVALVRDELREVDISAVFSGLLDPNSPGNDYVSIFFWFPTGQAGAQDARVLGMRFVYASTPLETASLADGAVTSAKVLDGSLTSADIADGEGSGLDADLLDGLESGAFAPSLHAHDLRYYTQTQLHTAGAGGAVHWSNLTGVPTGFADGVDDDTLYTAGPGLVLNGTEISLSSADSALTPRGNAITTLASAGAVGRHTSVTIGADGLGLISYYDDTNGDLEVAHCDDPACTSATLSTLDTTGDVGAFTSATIGADGLGLISYYDNTNGDLRVAHCDDVPCTHATLSTLDTTGNVGLYTSVIIGSDGLGLISYYDNSPNWDLRVAHCDDVTCTSATLSTLDTDGGQWTSLAIGSDGLGLISYYDGFQGDLKVAHCGDVPCTSATLSTLDSAGFVGWHTSLAIGSDGLGLISYFDNTNSDLKVAHCSDVPCTSATLSTVDAAGTVGFPAALAVGDDERGLIVYNDNTNGVVKVAHCNDVPCTSATLSVLDAAAGSNSQYFSVTIGADGLGLVSYWDSSRDDLKVAHCANALCVPFFRRR